jgi:hypothetical protein
VTSAIHKGKQATATPRPKSEVDELAETRGAQEHALLKQLQAFLDSKGAPVFNEYWDEITTKPQLKAARIGAANPSADLRTTGKTGERK